MTQNHSKSYNDNTKNNNKESKKEDNNNTRIMELSQAIRELDDEDLLEYIQEEIENKGKQKDLMELIVWDPNSCARKAMAYTSLQMVLYHGRCKKIIFKLIELGGRELVMMKSSHGENVLKKACESKNASLDIISKLKIDQL